ncbi:MAG: tetratricopeptide repeat protein [Armatimonadetes bacterium]|nr:tetratricopeptide repeat protein [Armatimonadota bacterium]
MVWLSLRPTESYDLWFHLATGRYISRTHSVPKVDPFSSIPGRTWQPHEWLAGWGLYEVYQGAQRHFPGGGLLSLVLLKSLLVCSTFGLLYWVTRCSGVGPLTATCLTAVAVLASLGSLDVRPEILSFLFFTCFMGFWMGSRSAGSVDAPVARFWYLPFISVLWCNLHAAFVSALGLIGIGLFLEWAGMKRRAAGCGERRRLRQCVTLWGACILASFANPFGPGAFLYPLRYLAGGSHYATTVVTEWLPPDFHRLPSWMFLALVLTAGFAFLRSWDSACRADLVHLLAWGVLSALHRRYIPFFALASAPIVAERLRYVAAYQYGRTWLMEDRKRYATASGLVCVAWVLIVGQLGRGNSLTVAKPVRADLIPVDASEFISRNELPGKLYNSYHFGGYLIWKLFPRYRVFVDGRADVYGEGFLKRYVQIETGETGALDSPKHKGINLAVVALNSGIHRQLARHRDWARVYQDGVAAVYVRKCPETRALLRRWGEDLLWYPGSPEVTFFRGLEAAERGQLGKAEIRWRECLVLNPQYAEAYANLGTLYARREDWAAAISCWRKAIGIDPEGDPQIYINLGQVYARQKRQKEARECFEKSLSLDPSSAEARKLLDAITSGK